jgi:hypothetical protein
LNVAGQLLHRGAALGHLVPAHARVEIFTIAAGPVKGAAGRASFPEVVSNWQRAGFAVSAVSNECVKHGLSFQVEKIRTNWPPIGKLTFSDSSKLKTSKLSESVQPSSFDQNKFGSLLD